MQKARNNNQNALFIQGVSEQEFKEFFTQLFEEQLGRKLNSGSEMYFNGSKIGQSEPNSKSFSHGSNYLTRGEVSRYLQISLPTLHSYVRQGLIKSYRIGGKVRFKLEEVDQALTERNFTSVMRKGGNHAA